ncbi:MAG: hypothetical protein M3Q74_09755 [Pseudomonadota bacterium]|nr:hypothetical protein [Pseudomonadota bacterium]
MKPFETLVLRALTFLLETHRRPGDATEAKAILRAVREMREDLAPKRGWPTTRRER